MPLKGGLVDSLFSKLFKIQLSTGAALIDPGPVYLSVFTGGIRIFSGSLFFFVESNF